MHISTDVRFESGISLYREWNGGFWIKGPNEDANVDDDNMPGWWEARFPCLDSTGYDAQGDPDHDGLASYDEFEWGLNPCRPEWDRGRILDLSSQTAPRTVRCYWRMRLAMAHTVLA